MPPKKKLSPEEKSQILNLYIQGLNAGEIAQQMHIDNAQQVVGIIRAAENFGKVPRRPKEGAAVSMSSLPPLLPPAPPTLPPPAPAVVLPPDPVIAEASIPPAPVESPVPQVPPPSVSRPVRVPTASSERRPVSPPPTVPAQQPPSDGFGSTWSTAPGFRAGFNFQAPTITYKVYREEPTNEGLLGEHVDPFGETELAKLYGSGLYRIQRFTPGNPNPAQTMVRVSSNYGPPKYGNRQNNPGYGRFGAPRPWMSRSQDSREEEGVNDPQFDRPRMIDYARHSPASDATAAAIKIMGDMNLKALEQVETARKQGPDTFITRYFQDESTRMKDQIAEQRRVDEQRRKEDEERNERRAKDADREHQRRQDDEEKRHARELEKLRIESENRQKATEAERKMLLDLEEKRRQVDKEDYKRREEQLERELKQNREEQRAREERIEKQLNEMREQAQAQIQDAQEKLEKELTREREQLDRELKLKEKHLEKEHELNKEILDVKKAQLESQGTNEVLQVVNNLINRFSGALKEVVELKKVEASAALAPEAQAAAVVSSMGDKKQEEPKEQTAPQPEAAPAATQVNGNGNGQGAHVGEERPMQETVQQMVGQKFFQEVLDEWALHVKTGQDATTFVNMYMNWMNDPADPEGRKATSMFANFMAPRPWKVLYEIMKPKLKKEVIEVFETKEAEDYYETFRGLVTESIRAYWEGVAEEREAVKAARRSSPSEPARK